RPQPFWQVETFEVRRRECSATRTRPEASRRIRPAHYAERSKRVPAAWLVGCDAGPPQVVQPPQDVVVPTRWEGNVGPRRLLASLAIHGDDLAGRSRFEQAPLEEILLSAKASGSDVGPRTL